MALNDKQKLILNTAEALFACKGYDGSSIRDIAEAAKVNIAMISYYFGSKEKLMEELFKERTAEVKLRLEKLLDDTHLDPADKINIIVDEYVERVWSRQQFFKIMVSEQMLQKNQEITSLVNSLKRDNILLIDKIIKDGQKKKLFKKHIDTVLLVNTLTGVALHALLNKENYRAYHHLENEDDATFHLRLKEKTTGYLKHLMKTILHNEA